MWYLPSALINAQICFSHHLNHSKPHHVMSFLGWILDSISLERPRGMYKQNVIRVWDKSQVHTWIWSEEKFQVQFSSRLLLGRKDRERHPFLVEGFDPTHKHAQVFVVDQPLGPGYDYNTHRAGHLFTTDQCLSNCYLLLVCFLLLTIFIPPTN